MEERINPKRARIIILRQKDGRAYFLPLKLASVFFKMKVDIVHTHNYYTGVYGIPAAKLLRIPVIHGEHGFNYDQETEDISKKKGERWLCLLADHVTSVSKRLKDKTCGDLRIAESKVTVITNGVDFEKFSQKTDVATQKEKHGIDPGTRVVGSVGRLNYQKNYKLLLRAFADVTNQTRKNIQLLLVGEGPERKNLENLAIELNISRNIKMIGERNDIPEIISIMDIFVLPSFLEGMSNTILEAMCAGIPVVASDVGGNSELVENGKSGFLFESNLLEGLKECIGKLASDDSLRKSMGERGKKIAEEGFSVPVMVKKYEQIYMEWFKKRKSK
jgi:glycosyltransferase involved in cell wall biosynthesis